MPITHTHTHTPVARRRARPTRPPRAQALLAFAGCVVCVSHDRFFLDRLCTHILAAEGEGRWVWHEGNYEEYEAARVKRMGDDLPAPIKYATLA